MTIIGWFELYDEGSPVGVFSPYYDMLEWIEQEGL